jgi:hypothetical protein
MTEVKVSKRDQVLAFLTLGTHTRIQMAEALDCKVASISSNFTYLRWMGNFITANEDGTMRLCTEEESVALEEAKVANRKAKSTAEPKTPEEQAAAANKALARAEKTLETWEQRQDAILVELEGDDEVTEELTDRRDEAAANITLLKIKIKRTKARLIDLPEADEPADIEDEATEEEIEEELM